MAWYPRAVRKQLTVPRRATPSGRLAMPSPVRINLHTAVSNSYSLAWDERNGNRAGYFNTTGAGGVFSHFYIRSDGVVEQMQDTQYRASCDLDGNPDTISIETWDGYRAGYPGYWKTGSDVPPLNPAQAEGLVKLLRWLLDAHPSIPAKLAVSNRRGAESQGFSYHRLGAPGYALYTQAEGGLLYTNSYKKGCPGARKIGQMAGILTAATTESEEDDMPYTEAQLSNIVKKAMTEWTWTDKVQPGNTGVPGTSWRNNTLWTIVYLEQLLGLTRELAAKAGVDIDEAALANRITAGVLPALTASLAASIESKLAGVAGVDAKALAREVVAEFAAAIQG